VQEEVERALCTLLRACDVPLTVAGRTDAGVHALGQVASYEGPPAPLDGLNALLPDDVAALACSEAPDGFDARRDATSRAYCYRLLTRPGRSALWRGRALHWPHRVDLDALRECSAALIGTHDFTAFTPSDSDHVRFERDVYAAFWRRGASDRAAAVAESGARVSPDPAAPAPESAAPAPESAAPAPESAAPAPGPAAPAPESAAPAPAPGPAAPAPDPAAPAPGPAAPAPESAAPAPAPDPELLDFWIEADAFMRHMNRVLVGTMLEVSSGRRSLADFVGLLEGRPRSKAGPTAPAHGLYLAGAGYGERVLPRAPRPA
jgi:tRNA U38,U39,U40 pseudouridine synthase TruA